MPKEESRCVGYLYGSKFLSFVLRAAEVDDLVCSALRYQSDSILEIPRIFQHDYVAHDLWLTLQYLFCLGSVFFMKLIKFAFPIFMLFAQKLEYKIAV